VPFDQPRSRPERASSAATAPMAAAAASRHAGPGVADRIVLRLRHDAR
jgi:hypothetical protein